MKISVLFFLFSCFAIPYLAKNLRTPKDFEDIYIEMSTYSINNFATKSSSFIEPPSGFATGNNNFNHDRHYSKVNGSLYDPDDDLNGNYFPVMTALYTGQWNVSNKNFTQQFKYLNESSGFAEFKATDSGLNIDDNVTFYFFDGQYTDQKGAYVNFVYNNKTDFNPMNSTFKNNNITFKIILFENRRIKSFKNCTGSYQLSFTNSRTKGIYLKSQREYANAVANFWLDSSDCQIGISAIVEVINAAEENKAMTYVIMVTLVCLSHLYGCIQIIRHVSLNETDGTRYSLVTIGIITSWDIFLCFFHFYGALIQKSFFHYFITPAFWYFILSSILESRLLLIIWKAKYYNSFQTIDDLRRGLTTFYGKFYGFLFAFILLCYFFAPQVWVFYATSLFLVPQIIHNAMRGQRYKFDWCYVLLLCAMRIFIPLYVKGYSESLFKYSIDPSFRFYYPLIVLTQVLVLFLQSKLGSRFFIPAICLPERYDYYVKLLKDTTIEESEICSICMDHLTEEANDNKTQLLVDKMKPNGKLMKTPCRHYFHEKCLKGWMEIKLECPFCRAPLPSID